MPNLVLDCAPFQIQVWCSACYNNNFDGCFDGGFETLDGIDGEPFPSVEAAIEAGKKWRSHGSLYCFRVIDNEGLDIRPEQRELEWPKDWD